MRPHLLAIALIFITSACAFDDGQELRNGQLAPDMVSDEARADDTPDAPRDEVPDVPRDEVPDVEPPRDMTPDAQPDATADAPRDEVPDITPDVAPDVPTDPVCECSEGEGPCCDGCMWRGEDEVCDTRWLKITCSHPLRGTRIFHDTYCTGTSSACEGRREERRRSDFDCAPLTCRDGEGDNIIACWP